MAARLFVAALLAVVAPLAAGQSVEGKFGRALKVGQTFAAADHNPIYAVTPVTVELWARVNGRDTSILLSNEPRNSKTHWELYTEQETGRFAVGMPGYAPKSVVSTADIADDQWHYLAYQFDGQRVRLFVDGRAVADAPSKMTAPYYDTGPLLVGFQTGVPAHADTTVDEVRISRVIRDVSKVPEAPVKRDAETVGLWHFDEDDKAVVKAGFADDSATANSMRLKQREEGVVDNGGFNNTVGNKTRWNEMDFGPFFSSTITPPLDKKNVTYKGISIQLGKDRKHFVTFDTELLRMSAAWEGKFIDIPAGREGLSNHPVMGGKPLFETSRRPGWLAQLNVDDGADQDTRFFIGSKGPATTYRGLYVHKNDVVLSYTLGGMEVLEHFGIRDGGPAAFTRSFQIAPRRVAAGIHLCDIANVGEVTHLPNGVRIASGSDFIGIRLSQSEGKKATLSVGKRRGNEPAEVTVFLTESDDATSFTVGYLRGTEAVVTRFMDAAVQDDAEPDLLAMTKGGPPRYPNPIITKGTLGTGDGPWVVDTLTAPDNNPWNSFLRFGGHDFFSNGDAAICSVSGDVWVVSGIDDKLEKLSWRRFATGLFQPLGLKIVDDKVYVLGRDQITRLHDLNADGEADFYENFNNDGIVTTHGHAYVACLERDPAGNFYYIKCGDKTPHGGTVLKVSPDGKRLSVHATGVRNANGLGMSPTGVVSFADNQGDWVPASRIDLITQPRQFLGYTPMSKTDTPPTDPGKPIVWLPQNMDNSSGSQVWVKGDRWGLPDGTMLHTSYGAAALLQIMPQTVKLPDGGEVTQAAAGRFPLSFSTGIMRGAFRQQDGQLYVSGLRGWQTAGTKDGAFQRVRYTGKPLRAPTGVEVQKDGIKLSFSDPLDPETANDPDSYSILQWNYRWSSEYGSKHWSVKNPDQQGYDTVEVKSAKLLADGKSVLLAIDSLKPVMQMRISINVDCKDGETIKTDLYNTIHAVP